MTTMMRRKPSYKRGDVVLILILMLQKIDRSFSKLKSWNLNGTLTKQQTTLLNIMCLFTKHQLYLGVPCPSHFPIQIIHMMRPDTLQLVNQLKDGCLLSLIRIAGNESELSVPVKSHVEKGKYMKMTNKTELNDELRPEYDETLLKNGTRGKYTKEYEAGTNIVRLDPDVAAAFPTEEAVNEALRSVLKEKNMVK